MIGIDLFTKCFFLLQPTSSINIQKTLKNTVHYNAVVMVWKKAISFTKTKTHRQYK